MPRQTAKEYRLIDDNGNLWAIASLTLTRLNALVREYKKMEIYLTAKEIA